MAWEPFEKKRWLIDKEISEFEATKRTAIDLKVEGTIIGRKKRN